MCIGTISEARLWYISCLRITAVASLTLLVFVKGGIIPKENYYDEEPSTVTSNGLELPPLPGFLMTTNVNFIDTLLTAYLAQYQKLDFGIYHA